MKVYVEVRLYASLKSKTPGASDQFPIDPGATVADVMAALEIPLESVKLIFINGVKGEPYSKLTGGERIAIFPPVGGG